jgi:hypothetical protein
MTRHPLELFHSSTTASVLPNPNTDDAWQRLSEAAAKALRDSLAAGEPRNSFHGGNMEN